MGLDRTSSMWNRKGISLLAKASRGIEENIGWVAGLAARKRRSLTDLGIEVRAGRQ